MRPSPQSNASAVPRSKPPALPRGERAAEVFATELGPMRLVFEDDVLVQVDWRADLAGEPLETGLLQLWKPVEGAFLREPGELARRLVRFGQGTWDDFRDVRIVLPGTDFARAVIAACRAVGPGATRSYSDLAEVAGSPRASRAVGSVMSKNTTPLVVPCHRILGKQGGLHGYSAAGGLATKQRLLDLERRMAESR